MTHVIHTGDVADVLPTLNAGSFDAVLCDPPYGLKFMGKAWDHGVPSSDVWAAVHRVLKPGAHIMAFGGTRTFHRLACAIEDADFAIRDCLMWMYGSGFPKSLNVSKAIDKAAGAEREVTGTQKAGSSSLQRKSRVEQGYRKNLTNCDASSIDITAPATDDAKLWTGYGTALKPAWEPVILAMKATTGTFVANALAHGVAGLDIDGNRVGERWPANVILDEEAGAALDEQTGTLKSGSRAAGVRKGMGYHGADGDGGPAITSSAGGASRFFYCAKVSKAERNGSKHPTLKPQALIEYLAKLLLPPQRADGTPRRILVPFSGAGSEMIGCLNAGWNEVVGIEMDPEYVADAERRLESL